MADPAYVAGFLKRHDPDRYFASLVLPAEARAPVQAIWAFSADVAAIPDRVRDPMAGEIRLQWWRDAILGQRQGEADANPLAAALLDATSRFGITDRPLLELLEARAFDLYADPMPDVPAFEGYAGATVSIPYQLAAMVLNGGRPVEPGDAAGHLGVAHALTGHLRALGHNARRGRIFLPWSAFVEMGVEREEVLAGTVSEGLLAAVAELQDLAESHLGRAGAAVVALPRALRPAFAMIAVLASDLALLRRNVARPFDVPPRRADWRRIAALAWWTWRNA